MTRQSIRLAVVAGLGLACFAGAAQAATFVAFPTQARAYATWIVRAMDQCSPALVSVVGANLPSAGCVQANSTTDGDAGLGATMKFARLIVRRFDSKLHGEGLVTLFGAGFKSGQRTKVRLTLRVTKKNITTKHPPATNNVTFADTTIDCGNQIAGCFSARANGVLAGKQSMAECLTQNGQATGLAQENIQIVDAALVNCDTGKVFGVPGYLD